MSNKWPLLLTALFAAAWICHRANVQSITLDEADTYFLWVAPAVPTYWTPNSNNHVLNSILMRLFIGIFGLSEMTMRLPALIGGLLYIFAGYRITGLLAPSALFRWSLFVCLVYNPFIMDYLVAARGYGLALGFLSLAIYLFASLVIEDQRQWSHHKIMGISACAGLSICANFTFAYASGFLLLIAALVSFYPFRKTSNRADWLRFAAATFGPALLVLLVLAGSAITRFPRSQLFWGSHSLLMSWRDIRHASFAELNPLLVNPLLSSVLDVLQSYIFRALAVFAAAYTILFIAGTRKLRQPSALLAASLTLVLALTVLAHWLQFKLFNIPLPYERTSIFVVPLATCLMGSVLSIEPFNYVMRAFRGLAVGILLVSGLYFIGTLRDSYFQEWRIGAEVKSAFPVIRDLCRKTNSREVISDPNLASSLNFYRNFYQAYEIDALRAHDSMPTDKQVYVLPESHAREFIQTAGLEVAWRGTVSDLVILVRPLTGATEKSTIHR